MFSKRYFLHHRIDYFYNLLTLVRFLTYQQKTNKMKLSVISIMVVAMVAMACATKKNAGSVSDAEYSDFKPVAKNDTTFASIERTFCFGTCPVYTLTIGVNGNATYEGTRNVDMLGTYSGKFTPAQMNTLIESAKNIEYLTMESSYDNPHVTDLPSTTTSIVIDGKRKQVMRRIGFPQSIKVFEDTFDELAKEVKWTLVKAVEVPR